MAKSYTKSYTVITILYRNMLLFNTYPELAVSTQYQGPDAM